MSPYTPPNFSLSDTRQYLEEGAATEILDATGARCSGKDLEEHTTDGYTPTDALRVFCAGCPIYQRCLDWAMTHDEWGIWAGTSREERGLLRRGRWRARCPICHADSVTWNEQDGSQICVFCGWGWLVRRNNADER